MAPVGMAFAIPTGGLILTGDFETETYAQNPSVVTVPHDKIARSFCTVYILLVPNASTYKTAALVLCEDFRCS